MNPFFDKEYHPVIEAFISKYVDDELDHSEKNAFEELLVYDDDLRDLAVSAKKGKQLLENFRKTKSYKELLKRLNGISPANN